MPDPRARRSLSLDARTFKPAPTGSEASQPNRNEHLSHHQKQLGERLYPKVRLIYCEVVSFFII